MTACDTDRGPCACGAWHVMPADVQSEPVFTDSEPTVELNAADEPIPQRHATSCQPACDPQPCLVGKCQAERRDPPKTLLLASKELRAAQRKYMAVRDAGSRAVKDQLGREVAAAAEELDRAIEATEKRQAPPVEPSISEQVAMGVHFSGGETEIP